PGPDGRLWAINPENGYFGVAPGTSYKSNSSAMKSIEKNTLFTNVALTPDGDVWWEGMDTEPPPGTVDWQGKPWKQGGEGKVAHPPRIFMVNWFRKSKDSQFLWPGYGENMRVLKWIIDRALVRTGGQETPVGWVPREGDIDLSGLDISSEGFAAATRVNLDE